jgi:hypothetical protein
MAQSMFRAVAKSREIVGELDRYTEQAQERGVFGSPFYFFEKEIFGVRTGCNFSKTQSQKRPPGFDCGASSRKHRE